MLSERTIGSANADRAAAFSELAERHLADSYRLAALILGERADAEDATQDAFVAAWKSWSSLRDPAHFEAWFGRILVNVCRDRLRRSRRHGVTDPSLSTSTRRRHCSSPWRGGCIERPDVVGHSDFEPHL